MPRFTVPVEFKGATYGLSASIGIHIKQSEKMNVERAEESFVHKRIRVTLKGAGPNGEDAKQKRIKGTEAVEFTGTVDVKGYRRVRDTFGLSLKFDSEEEGVEQLRELAEKPGNLIVLSVEDIPETVKVGSAPADGQTAFDEDED